MSAITTHVLDIARGRPAAGVSVLLEQRVEHDDWRAVGQGETDTDGRVRNLVPDGSKLTPGVHRLTFETQQYFQTLGVRSFYPQVIVVFDTTAGETHYHVPLLLGPFGYTTYRGS